MTSSTLIKSFERAKEDNRAALLTYTVGGDPDKKTSLNIFKSIAEFKVQISLNVDWDMEQILVMVAQFKTVLTEHYLVGLKQMIFLKSLRISDYETDVIIMTPE